MKWNKATGDVWSTRGGPFSLRVAPKGDGRWNWQVFRGENHNPEASGVASSLGAAKTATEQFVKRSGLV
jgi:hypothetical protein